MNNPLSEVDHPNGTLSTFYSFYFLLLSACWIFCFCFPCGRISWDQKEDIMHKFTICKTVCLVSDNEHWVLPLVLVKHVLCFGRGWKLWKMTDCPALAACQVVIRAIWRCIPQSSPGIEYVQWNNCLVYLLSAYSWEVQNAM